MLCHFSCQHHLYVNLEMLTSLINQIQSPRPFGLICISNSFAFKYSFDTFNATQWTYDCNVSLHTSLFTTKRIHWRHDICYNMASTLALTDRVSGQTPETKALDSRFNFKSRSARHRQPQISDFVGLLSVVNTALPIIFKSALLVGFSRFSITVRISTTQRIQW